MSVNISFGSANFQDNAKVVGIINDGKDSSQTENALKELESLRLDLDKVEQLREAITSLEAAIRAENQPKVKTIMQQVASNFAYSSHPKPDRCSATMKKAIARK